MRPPLGQHFLRDPTVVRDIMAAAALHPGERVLEVGPGTGILTDALATAVGDSGGVVAVEADAGLAKPLRGRWENVRVVAADAVRVDLHAHGPYDAIVANLPYQISGPVTMRFLDLLRPVAGPRAGIGPTVEGGPPARGWSRAVLMFQKEFAERLRAGPGSKTYGRLSVHVARWCAVERVRSVGPGAFDPPPQVDSEVVRLVPHPQPPFPVPDERLFAALVDGVFQHRRKMLRNTVPTAVADHRVAPQAALRALERFGWQDRRPEQLAPADLARLAVALREAA